MLVSASVVKFKIFKRYWNFIYLFINYNTITNYILIIYELNNFDYVLGVVSQTRVSVGNRTHDPHTNCLAQYPLYYQGTQYWNITEINFGIREQKQILIIENRSIVFQNIPP